MFCQFNKSVLALLVLNIAYITNCFAADEKQLSVKAVSGKEVCQSKMVVIADISVKSELCVLQGSFAHDTYTLNIDGKVLLKGIDDETTVGISSDYKNHKISLVCAPQNVFPMATPEKTLAEVKRVMPNSTLEEVTEIANLLGPGPMSMEIGRMCNASSDSNHFMSVQILFN